jgi:hypothetical protein
MPLAILATFLDRRGRYEPAAIIAGFALNTLTESSLAAITITIAHLREVLGNQKYESLAPGGQTMTVAAMAIRLRANRPSPGRTRPSEIDCPRRIGPKAGLAAAYEELSDIPHKRRHRPIRQL